MKKNELLFHALYARRTASHKKETSKNGTSVGLLSHGRIVSDPSNFMLLASPSKKIVHNSQLISVVHLNSQVVIAIK